MTKIWKAVDEQGYSLCTVTISQREGESVEDFQVRARAEVGRQLDRPGRRQYLKRWEEGGKRLIARL